NQSLLETYLSVALKVSRTAVGSTPPAAELMFKPKPGTRQNEYQDGMPFGTQGGVRMEHIFPVDGEYEFEVNAGGRGQMDLSIDGERVKLIEVKPVPRPADYDPDAGILTEAPKNPDLTFKMAVKGGPHVITAAYIKSGANLKIEGDRTPYWGGSGAGGGTSFFNAPGVSQITLRGPLKVLGKGDTPSRAKIFTCRPTSAAMEDTCAKQIVTSLARRAYRRPLTQHDTDVLMG